MQTLSHDAYLALCTNATVLERDLHGEKVLQLKDGSYLKLFRRKRLISSAAWYPYAQRFADNAQVLNQLNIPCPEVIAHYRIPSIQRDAIHYRPLVGKTIREIMNIGENTSQLLNKLGVFVAHLHESGVYFRSLHLGNIILIPDGSLGLIDIADMRIFRRPLGHGERIRNFLHLLRDSHDRQMLLPKDDHTLYKSYGDPFVTSSIRLVTNNPH